MNKCLYNLMEYSTSFWLFKKLTEHKLKPFLGAGGIHVPHLNFRFLNFLCSGIWRSTRVISFVSNFLGPLRGLGEWENMIIYLKGTRENFGIDYNNFNFFTGGTWQAGVWCIFWVENLHARNFFWVKRSVMYF